MVEKRIIDLGYKGKLEFDPIPNTFKRRNHFTKKVDGTGVFTAFMWQMNTLSEDELAADIDERINEKISGELCFIHLCDNKRST